MLQSCQVEGKLSGEIEIDESIIDAVYQEYLKLLADVPKN